MLQQLDAAAVTQVEGRVVTAPEYLGQITSDRYMLQITGTVPEAQVTGTTLKELHVRVTGRVVSDDNFPQKMVDTKCFFLDI